MADEPRPQPPVTHREDRAVACARAAGLVPRRRWPQPVLLHLVAVGVVYPNAAPGASRYALGLNRTAPSAHQAAALAGVHCYAYATGR